MNTKYEIIVTAEDCAEGVRNNERYCVVATAIARLEPDATRIEVNVNTIRFSLKDGGKMYRLAYPTSPVVREYIKAFDAGVEAKPMKFTLDDPQIAEKRPEPRLRAKTPSFKPQESPKSRRSVRVFGEKSFASR